MNRIKVFTILTSALFLMSCTQNKLNGSDCFLLLKDKGTISLNIYKNNKIKEIKTFPISEKSIYTTDQKERVAILDTAKNVVMLYDIQTGKETELSIPFDIEPRCVFLNNDNLFVGGEMGEKTLDQYLMQNDKKAINTVINGDTLFVSSGELGGELLIQYHIQSEKWYQLEIPKEASSGRKAIDDLVVNDSLLIAIDNEITPKYILFYCLNSAERLPFSHFKELQSRLNEDIHQGRITPDYFGIRSKTITLDGVSEYITIYKGLDLTESFAISTSPKSLQEQDFQTYNDFLIIGNKVVIANAEKGLEFFDINDLYFKKILDEHWHYPFEPISDSTVSYKTYPNENIIRLTQIPNTTKIVLTIENSSKNIRYQIVGI